MRPWIVLLILLGAIAGAFATEMLPASEVKRGMAGYGLSVFHGWEPEAFGVEIVDVVRNANPGGDLILARLSGQNLETSGIIAGMSGSPVYITNAGGHEKLIGAVAFGWPSTKETIGCIQPIMEMLAEKSLSDPADAPSPRSASMLGFSLPVSAAGFSGEALRFISETLGIGSKDKGSMLDVAGFASGESEGPKAKGLHPGDGVAINMVDGDLRLQGVGTVTYVSNGDVYIFGHQMDLAGNVKLPVSRSYIYSVISADPLSFKMGSSSEPLGATAYDGVNGVYCRLGEAPAMVPVELNLSSWAKQRSFRFRVADSKTALPGLVAACVSSSLVSVAGALEDKRVSMDFRIDLRGPGGERTISNRFQYSFVPSQFNSWMLLNDLQGWLSFLLQNDLAPLSVLKIALSVEMERGVRYYLLQGASFDKLQYQPGDTVKAKVRLREYRGGTVYREARFLLPDKLASGQYRVMIGSDSAVISETARLYPRLFAVQNYSDLERLAQLRQESSSLVVALAAPKNGLYLSSGKLENFPPQYLRLFTGGLDSANPSPYPEIIQDRQLLDAALFGFWSGNINVAERPAAQTGD